MFETEQLTRHFTLVLSRVRQNERFSLGRRLLAMIALGCLRDKVEDNELWLSARRNAYEQAGAELRRDVTSLAVSVERRRQELKSIFTQALATDVLQTPNLPEIVQYASAFTREFDLFGLTEFGAWLSQRLDDTQAFGPVISDLATSPRLSDLLVQLAGVRSGGTVYDPCCGMGNLLIAARRLAGPGVEAIGVEAHPTSWAFAKLRMELIGAVASVELRDSLRNPYQRAGGFDHIVCEPPAGGSAPRSSEAGPHLDFGQRIFRLESAFILHCAESLSANGQAAVLVPQSVLSRKGPEERLRQRLVSAGQVAAIVSLPASVGAWATSDLAVLVLRPRTLTDHTVRMVDGSRALRRERRGPLSWAEIERLTSLVTGPLQEDAAVDVRPSELLAGDRFRPSLNFSNEVETVDIDELLAAADQHDAFAQDQAIKLRRLSSQLSNGEDG